MDIKPGSAEMADFKLGTPALVCRWRLQNGKLPLENRHLRALSLRKVNGAPVSPQLIAWAKQHIEWTLAEGTAECPNGVLMLVIDDQGQAAMSVGPYEPLGEKLAAELARRGANAAAEAAETGVAPEVFVAVRDGALLCGVAQNAHPCGALTLVNDLAKAFGIEVKYDEKIAAAHAASPASNCDEAFLVSDEHGIAPAADCNGPVSTRFTDAYAKLLDSTAQRR